MAKKPVIGTSIQQVTISRAALSLDRVGAAIRDAESALAENGKLTAGATLLRADMDQRGNVTAISFEADASLHREVANQLRKGRSRIKVGSATVHSAASLLKE
jgi:hypothetical protein